jgi:hypothetical protein
MEAYLDGDVEINNNVGAPDNAAEDAEIADQTAEVASDTADATEEAKDTEVASQMLGRMCDMYDHVKQFGIDRTFVSLYNRHGELDRVCGIQFPSCESMDVVGDRYSQYSTAFIAAMESSGSGLWAKIKAFIAKIWNWIKETASTIWNKILKLFGKKKNILQRGIDALKRVGRNVRIKAKGAFKKVITKFKDAGAWVMHHKKLLAAIAGALVLIQKFGDKVKFLGTNLKAMTGGAVGGTLGGAIGSAVGGAVGRIGGRIQGSVAWATQGEQDGPLGVLVTLAKQIHKAVKDICHGVKTAFSGKESFDAYIPGFESNDFDIPESQIQSTVNTIKNESQGLIGKYDGYFAKIKSIAAQLYATSQQIKDADDTSERAAYRSLLDVYNDAQKLIMALGQSGREVEEVVQDTGRSLLDGVKAKGNFTPLDRYDANHEEAAGDDGLSDEAPNFSRNSLGSTTGESVNLSDWD